MEKEAPSKELQTSGHQVSLNPFSDGKGGAISHSEVRRDYSDRLNPFSDGKGGAKKCY